MSVVLLMHKDGYKSAHNERNGSVEELPLLNPPLSLSFFFFLGCGTLTTSQTGFHEARSSSSPFSGDDEPVAVRDGTGPAPPVPGKPDLEAVARCLEGIKGKVLLGSGCLLHAGNGGFCPKEASLAPTRGPRCCR